MMDGDQDNTLQHGSRQDISPATMNGVSAETTEEISPSQHERWRDLVFDIQLRAQEDAHDDFLRANESFPPYTPSPASKRFNFSPIASPRNGRRVGSMSPSSSRRTTLKNVFNFKGQNNNADIEEGVALVYEGRDKYNIPRTWSLTNILTPKRSKKTESLPVTPLAHSNPESMHGSYAVDDHVTSMAKQPVSCIVLATMVGFGLTMSGTTVITMFIEWRRSHAHHQPTNTHAATPPCFRQQSRKS